MEISEINLSKITNEQLVEIYNRTEEYIEFLQNEIKINELEKK